MIRSMCREIFRNPQEIKKRNIYIYIYIYPRQNHDMNMGNYSKTNSERGDFRL
jgi:hypothetical protein